MAATSALAGISARSGLGSGMNSATVMFELFRYAVATRCTSSGVTFRSRSRFRNSRRQSPLLTHSLMSARSARNSELQIDTGEQARPRAVDFLLARRLLRQVLDGVQQDRVGLSTGPACSGSRRIPRCPDRSDCNAVASTARPSCRRPATCRGARRVVPEHTRQHADRREVRIAIRLARGTTASTAWMSPTRRRVTRRSPSCTGSTV